MTFSYNYDGGLIFHLQARVSMAWETWVTLLLPFAFHLSLRIFDPYSVTIYKCSLRKRYLNTQKLISFLSF